MKQDDGLSTKNERIIPKVKRSLKMDQRLPKRQPLVKNIIRNRVVRENVVIVLNLLNLPSGLKELSV